MDEAGLIGGPGRWPLPDGVLLRRDARRGRHLVASRAFRAGELVLSQEAYRAVLLDADTPQRCDHTFLPRPPGSARKKLLRCSRSKLARYVSREAQAAAWRDGYKQECAALVRCAPHVPPPTVRLAARVLWRRQRELEAAAAAAAAAGSGTGSEEGPAAGGWDSWAAVEILENHWGEQSPARMTTYAQMAVLVREFMLGAGGDGAAGDGAASSVEAAAATGGLPPTRDIARLLACFGCNNHTICDDELRPIGVGIFPLGAMVNHACELRAPRTVEPPAPPLSPPAWRSWPNESMGM
jgi:SET and MYND domain-containing protein